MTKMTDNELLGIVTNHVSRSTGSYYTEVSSQRADAMDAYYQEPLGNETEGKSTIVTSEVADTVEWFLPSLMKVFTAGGKIAKFDAEDPGDTQASQEETDVINHYFFKKMDGFNTLYSWFKDALIQKNGIARVTFDTRSEATEERYKGLTEDEFTSLLADDELEPEEYDVDLETGLIDVTFIRTKDTSIPLVEIVPPEEFYINPKYEHLELSESPFCAQESTVTASELIVMGYPKDVVDGLNANSDYDTDQNEEDTARFADIGGGDDGSTEYDGSGDSSQRQIQLLDCYIRIDYDGDGVAELRHIVVANRVEVLENEPASHVPYISITPVPMPHRFFGRSIADQTMDIQVQKTTLLRNILDNLYLLNNQRTIVLEGGANIDDLLQSRAGGIAREYVKDAIRPFPTTPFSGHPYSMLDYFDGMKEARTGITKYNQGLDANSLNKTASGMGMIMDASQSRIELVARLFANGVAKMMTSIHRLMTKNIDRDLIMHLGGEFKYINPANWRDRSVMTVTVGLGTSDDSVMLERLTGLLQLQKEMQSLGLVTPVHIHNTLARIVESMGLQNVEEFFVNAEQAQPPPPQPDAQMEMVKGQMQTATEANQINREKNQMNFKVDMRKIDAQVNEAQADDMQSAIEHEDDNVYKATELELKFMQDVPGSSV